MSWKRFVIDYFTFSKKDRIATLLVLTVLFSIDPTPRLISGTGKSVNIQTDTSLTGYVDKVQPRTQTADEDAPVDIAYLNDYTGAAAPKSGFTKGALFTFDPNTLSIEGWQKLGLPARVAKTIHNYRSKGGRFYKPEDLQKIWGLPSGFYEHVADYIHIKENENIKPYEANASYPKYEKKERTIAMVSVNEADTAELIALPGIGPKLAQRIIAFRNKLGGFATADQIGETYGLPDSTFQKLKPYFKVNTSAPQKFNINTATKDELKQHPYIRWNLANAIVEYRSQHGAYSSVNDVMKIAIIDENTFQKIAPYLSH